MVAPRVPAVAGQFYAADGAALARQVESCFLDERGPGALPERHRTSGRRIRAAVVPHAGYPYSGPIAAHVYDAVAGERAPASVLILGVNHAGIGAAAALSDRDWTTPLGPVPVDHELVRSLTGGPIEVDEEAHLPEHSIEVQLPFLQYVLPKPRFAALMIRYGPLRFLREVGAAVRQATQGTDVLLLASTDFSHYVPPERADELDHLAIDAIVARDAQRLYDVVAERDISMCGIAPTTALLAALEGEPLTGRLLRWGHSGEAQTMSTVVGYAGLLLERDAAA
ncbi:MAG TPA: AmmeMemoRadiSam system protein B [Thermoplasmata archaeon]|nr:AmmeMemoRadiSam system protein B [Thermoplasmata archaeon]